jgi:hypothetical protein
MTTWARGSIDGWEAMLQNGKSRVQVPMKSLNFLILHNPSDRLCSLEVRVRGYGSRGPGSISGATGFSEK